MNSIRETAPEPVYRWVIVSASALMLALSMGMMVNGTSVFFIPLFEEFGWQRGDVSLINTSGLVGLAIGGIFMGRIADETPIRRVILVGAVVIGLCILGASQATVLWQFYVLFFIAGFLGAGALFAPLIANVGNWFKTGSGLALGIAAAGQALGQGGMPYVLALLIGALGWRDALMSVGLTMLVLLISLAMLIKQPPKNTISSDVSAADDPLADPVADVGDAVLIAPNTTALWLGAAAILCCICMAVPLMHLVPLMQDRGITLEEAGSVLFVMLIVAIAGRIAFGKLADMIGAIRTYLIASCFQTVLVFFFLEIDTLQGYYIFAVIYGFGYAGVMTSILVCVRVLTPVSKRASVLGIVIFFAFMGHGIGGYQGGFFFDLTGNYTLTYANAAFAGIINLILVGALYITTNRRRAALAFAT
ncbi:MAG: MFS transporter [Rhodospirillaceae bacterium]|nr:MFS transporter [Rhodospirillaceae bacterium]MBT7294206.1 MFS transporter [Rhodospirillaceae bacterium]